MNLTLTLGKRLTLLLCIFLVCFFINSVLSTVIIMLTSVDNTPAMRIVTILQDLIVFVIPPVATALLVTRTPATLLGIDRKPALLVTLLAVCVLLLSIPAMNMVIWANENVPLPSRIADPLRALEENSEAMIRTVIGAHTGANLLMSILIVGVLAGVSEELLFRGGLQRLLVTGGVNRHVAIWTTAAVFSLLHFQFFGFVPRMLLGAFFGYMLWWSGSLWLPMLLHSLNNILYVVMTYISQGHDSAFETCGAGNSWGIVALSALLTAAVLWLIRKRSAYLGSAS